MKTPEGRWVSLQAIRYISNTLTTNPTHRNLPVVYNMPDLDVSKGSAGVEEAILAIGGHGQNAVASLVHGIEFIEDTAMLMVRVHLNVARIK